MFQFTYNHKDNHFTQSQLSLMLDLPLQIDVYYYKKIAIMVAPPGIKVVEFDPNKSRMSYVSDGWVKKYVGEAPSQPHSVKNNMRGKRHQYGLKHHVTSTVHACMGNTLNIVVTEVSNVNNYFRLWDKSQAIVLLSRTSLGSNIIFVGNKQNTIDALS